MSDENEFVRDTALRAGKRIINQYAETAVELLLPELEKGLFDDNWRIRNSSVQLLGDLLYKVSGRPWKELRYFWIDRWDEGELGPQVNKIIFAIFLYLQC